MTENFKIVIPFLPSLLHIAAVKVAVPLCNGFSLVTLQTAFRKIELKTPIKEMDVPCCINDDRAQEMLLTIPSHLRKNVMEAIQGMKYRAERWKIEHSHILQFRNSDRICYWRSDGTIDSVKTVQQLAQNTNIDARKRFHLACIYCLEDDIKTLWAEMEASGKTLNFKSVKNPTIRFWVKRMREECCAPWRQVAAEYFAPSQENSVATIARLSCIFPLLQVEERKKFLFTVEHTKPDDFLLCMYSMTKKEEKEVMKGCLSVNLFIQKVLYIYLDWPFQNMFLERMEKLWNYIHEFSFCSLLNQIWENMEGWENLVYPELLENFWNSSPVHLRQRIKMNPVYRKKAIHILRQKGLR